MPGTVQSIERAAAILRVVAGSGGRLGVTDIAAAVGLAKTTAHSLLRTLLSVGFVEQDPATGRYALGPGLLRLGTPLDVNELRARSSNWADALAARSGHAVRLATLAGADVVVVHHVFRPDDSAQVLEVGTTLPARSTALGKVLLAYAPAPPAELAEVRTQGWAAERGEQEPSTGSIAAPVRAAGGLVTAALGVSGPLTSLFDGRGVPRSLLLAMVVDAAHAVSRELGHVSA
ncbi:MULTISPECIES: IclR family transcriptional regulator [unclassified Modestobacter]|uniref:IclR family transcriptional regulator n=1 Tax=unclassified Modestobacter TaxID=2643866 RepID=UPI0022AB086B|nr:MULTISPECIES: IclR family transcriptional regulator [unclassified Modestobacter]MCZ2823053.1 IclR family transcriptional regulator [Modestobacter sp. VKM Ac-2981]MCZ2851299.1 IclR family transcriptional regulator [Modestobacter sp. VKM Ac-2982]